MRARLDGEVWRSSAVQTRTDRDEEVAWAGWVWLAQPRMLYAYCNIEWSL